MARPNLRDLSVLVLGRENLCLAPLFTGWVLTVATPPTRWLGCKNLTDPRHIARQVEVVFVVPR